MILRLSWATTYLKTDEYLSDAFLPPVHYQKGVCRSFTNVEQLRFAHCHCVPVLSGKMQGSRIALRRELRVIVPNRQIFSS